MAELGDTADLGRQIDSATLEKGLRELNPDLHFDMGTKKNQWHPFQDRRQGVFYHGKHICSMDRGMVPEYKIWSVVTRQVPVSIHESWQDDVSVKWQEITPDTPGYKDMVEFAKTGKSDSLVLRRDGKLVNVTAWKYKKIRGRIVQVGWRHTFEKLILAKIPGVTRESLALKFSVDMWKWPEGAPEETLASIWEE